MSTPSDEARLADAGLTGESSHVPGPSGPAPTARHRRADAPPTWCVRVGAAAPASPARQRVSGGACREQAVRIEDVLARGALVELLVAPRRLVERDRRRVDVPR